MRNYLCALIFGVIANSALLDGMDDYGHIVCMHEGSIQTSFDHTTPEYANKIMSLLKKLASLSPQEPIDIRQLERTIVEQAKLSLPQEVVNKPVSECPPCTEGHDY